LADIWRHFPLMFAAIAIIIKLISLHERLKLDWWK
jgi:hypothetical protein